MDVNNMKVTDLKKELKSRGLSIVGNKSELIARLTEALLSTDGQQNANNEDSVLEEQLLGEESVADESISKTDDHLIDDLLDANETKDNSKPVVKEDLKIEIGSKSPTKALNQKSASLSPLKQSTDLTSNPNDSAINELKTTTDVKVLSAEERKQLRAQKFGDNKLNERANRFGLKPDSKNNSSNTDEKLQKRAQRFGSIVSDKLKQIDESQKLLKRKERFGVNTNSNVKTTTTTPITEGVTDKTSPGKRKITFSSDGSNDQKQKRLERFGKFL